MRLVESCRGPFWVWDQDHQGQQLEAKTWWDQHLQPAIDRVAFAHGDGWAIDLGASVGWFTTYFAEKFQRVIAVEAHPGTFVLLERNVFELRGLRNAELHNLAAFDRSAPMAWVSDAQIGWPIPMDLNLTPNASSVALEVRGGGSIPAVAMDSLFWTGDPVVLIKVDVQGCDLRALYGLSDTIARCRPTILFEFEEAASSWHGDTWEDYLAFFAARDYEVSHIHALDYLAVPR
jgi:FkbM family methyltransferase